MLSKIIGSSKSRLALLLHSDPAKRQVMSLSEFQHILHALDLSLVQVAIQTETFGSLELPQPDRYRPLIDMLCETFRGLPRTLINALEDVDGIDGTEVRAEWAMPLQKAVTRRLVDEVHAIIDRRNRFAQGDNFRI